MSSLDSHRRELDEITIGVLTALKHEYAACLGVMDPENAGSDIALHSNTGLFQCRTCTIKSKIGSESHRIAIVLLPDMGNNAAALAATGLIQHCPNTKYLFMCGIAGAVPSPSKPDDHVRLGDIVVINSQGMIQYDRGKRHDARQTAVMTGDPLAAMEVRSPPRPPSRDLLDTVNRIHAKEILLGDDVERDWEAKIRLFHAGSSEKEKWHRPSPTRDKLIDTEDGQGKPTRHPIDKQRRKDKKTEIKHPRVFHGPIGAANIVLADPVCRNALRDKHKIRAVEMEGSGIADASWLANVGYLIVRGTCDYCNSTKNDIWQNYAALIAACYTHTVIENLPPLPMLQASRNSADTKFSLQAEACATVPADSVFKEISNADKRGSASSTPQAMEAVTPTAVFPSNTSQRAISPDEFATIPAADVGATITQPRPQVQSERPIHAGDADFPVELINSLEAHLKDSNWVKAKEIFSPLLSKLESLPRTGAIARKAWLLLIQVEQNRLFIDKALSRPIDVSQLSRLRREFASVTN